MEIISLITLVFTDYTLRTVIAGAAVLGIVSGVLGSFAVLRKQALLGDAMSHAALPGVILAFLVIGSKAPLALMVGAIIAGWTGALLVMFITNQTRIKEDSGLGIVLAVFFALGIAIMSWIQHNSTTASQGGLDKYLFGRAAALVEQDVITMSILGGISILFVFIFWKEFKLLSFNPEFAATLGLPVRLLDFLITTLIVVAIVIGLQTVGVVLMSAMIIAPAVAARQWTDNLARMIVLAGFFGALAGVSGALISSLGSGLSTGPVIVLCVSALVLVSLFFAPNRGLISRWVQDRRNRRRMRRNIVLEGLYMMGLHHEDPGHHHSLEMLRAAMPGIGVQLSVQFLEEEGLVVHDEQKRWKLTPQGLKEAEALLSWLHEGEDRDHLSSLQTRGASL